LGPLKLVDLLAADRIVLAIEAETVREAARPLVNAVLASGRAVDPDRLEALLAESLPSEAVTVGQQVFLLHFRTDAVDELTAALGVTASPVHREHDPGREARVVLLLLAPHRETAIHLQALAAFARTLAQPEVVEALESATSPEAVLEVSGLADLDLSGELQVRDVLSPLVISSTPDATIGEVVRLMGRNRVDAVPIVSETREVLGLVTYAELLRHLIPTKVTRGSAERARSAEDQKMPDLTATPVREVMDRSVLCITDEQVIWDVASLMVNKNLERVPVVREGVLVGLLTRQDIVRRLFGP
jgi:CBS domain-containing protein